ncbi:MAG: hypothetical protein KIS83_13625 [Rubrivivax sp.]|nr:hypothetical protein [Rubrivivax sp.]
MAGPHEEGVVAGQAANPIARGNVTTPGATAVVPGYTTTPPERSYYRQPNLSSQGSAKLSACALTPTDPLCQAQHGAFSSANTPRPTIGPDDPAVAAARAIGRTPSAELGSLAAYYSGCTTTVTPVPAGMQPRSCLRYVGVGNYSCSRSLTVSTTRTTSCNPGDWFAHAASGRTGLDVQCLPDRAVTAQHFRVTQDGNPLSFFDVDMTTPVVFPQIVSVLDTTYSTIDGQPIRTAVWVADKSCSGSTCNDCDGGPAEVWHMGGGGSGYNCTSVEPFLKVRRLPRRRRAATTSDTVCWGDSGCTASALDGTRVPCARSRRWTPYAGIDITGTVAGTLLEHRRRPGRDRLGAQPAFGPIPTMRLSYCATTTVTETDRWDDQCPTLDRWCCTPRLHARHLPVARRPRSSTAWPSPATAGSTEPVSVRRRRVGRPGTAGGSEHAAVVDLPADQRVPAYAVRGRLQTPVPAEISPPPRQLPDQRLH